MGIPLGHKLKIMKRIKDIRTEKGLAKTKPEDIKYDEGISSRPVTQHQYEELPDPNAEASTEMSSILKSDAPA